MTKGDIAQKLRDLAHEGYACRIKSADHLFSLKQSETQSLEKILLNIADQLEND